MKQLIPRRSVLKAAGVTAAAASMAIGAPAASACWYGDKSDVTILYTNDVHTYIDKQSPKLTYAAIADLKQSYQNAGKDVIQATESVVPPRQCNNCPLCSEGRWRHGCHPKEGV